MVTFNPRIGVLCLWGLASMAVLDANAQLSQKSSVLDGSGTRSSGGAYTNISAAGQPGGISVSSGGAYVNQAGFLNTFFLKPGLDTDGAESVAGTDPTDSNAHLVVTDITTSGGNRFVEWVARSNKSYRLLRSDDPQQHPTNVIALVTANGPASPPWYVLSTSISDTSTPTNDGFYAVEVLP